MNMKGGQDIGSSTREVNPEKEDQIRCECGRLQARLTKDGVEIKCERCKRVKIVPLK